MNLLKSKIRKIGVFTSGGDSPGMNACIRAVVRTALHHGCEVVGIRRGYEGMIDGDFVPLERSSVSNIIQRGGTFLKSARSPRFFHKEGREQAYLQLQQQGIEGLVVIGGDGSFKGATILEEESGIPVVGTPGTIDNDLSGTDFTIGFDTAVNTAVSAIDKIRDTADAHDRLFFVEVMGRDAGWIALYSGIASGAEEVLIPETATDLNQIIHHLREGKSKQKTSSIVVVAEGDDAGGAFEIVEKLKPSLPDYDIRVTILGHIQRGGSPTAFDRVLASRMGVFAVETLLSGRSRRMIGIHHDRMVEIPFEQAVKQHSTTQAHWLKLVDILS